MISERLEKVLNRAVETAAWFGHEYVTLEHVLLSMLQDASVQEVVMACGGSVSALAGDLETHLRENLKKDRLSSGSSPKTTIAFQRLLQKTIHQTLSSGKDRVFVDSVLINLFSETESHAVYFLHLHGINREDVIHYVLHGQVKSGANTEEWSRLKEKYFPRAEEPQAQSPLSRARVKPSAEEGEGELSLEDYVTDLCEEAKLGHIEPILGREKELERILQVLAKRRKHHPLLVGDPGVGKTTLAEGLALRLKEGSVPSVLEGSSIYSLNLGSLLAGTKYRGDFEARCKVLFQELESKKKSILFIDEIHTLVGSGSAQGGGVDGAHILKPLLSSGKFRCIGCTTQKEMRKYFEIDPALARRFQVIKIEEPSQEETFKILEGLKGGYEDHHKVRYKHEALKEAIRLAVRFIRDKKLPDKAVDILDEVGALWSGNHRKKSIGAEEVRKVVARMTGVSMAQMSIKDRERLKDLGKDLKKFLFGQDMAISALEKVLKLSYAGLRPEQKPMGSFLFAGPTGVGKTELAKQLASTLGIDLVRFDMSEYMERHAVSRLIGAPPGYVGFDEGGLLTESISRKMHCVLLLDEIEKAHSDIHNLLLQVMDYGTLTDTNGREVDFRHVILIMTTNAGSDLAKNSLGFCQEFQEDANKNASLKEAFTPEFRNRLDAIVYFNQISLAIMGKIVDRSIESLEERLNAKKCSLKVTESARSALAKQGFDPLMGARPLQRLVEDKIARPLAEALLEKEASFSVKVDYHGQEWKFTWSDKKLPAKKKHRSSHKDSPLKKKLPL